MLEVPFGSRCRGGLSGLQRIIVYLFRHILANLNFTFLTGNPLTISIYRIVLTENWVAVENAVRQPYCVI